MKNWKRIPLTGNKNIDSQHEVWVKLMEELIHANSEQKHNVTRSVLIKLKNYTIFHFAYEESLMKKYSIDHFSRHKHLHSEFVKKLESLVAQLDSEEILSKTTLLLEMRDWLINHIGIADQILTLEIEKLKAS